MQGKRQTLAKIWHHCQGAPLWRASAKGAPPQVLCFHRIGTPDPKRGDDPGVFDMDTDGFVRQMRWVRKYARPIRQDHLVAWAAGLSVLPARAVLVTFDDGYRDNLKAAEILADLGMSAVFFVCPGLIASQKAGWWDRLHYALTFTKLHSYIYEDRSYNLPRQRDELFARLIAAMKLRPEAETRALVASLETELGASMPREQQAELLLNQKELRYMNRSLGMAIGSHTLSHRVLATLSPEEQRTELVESRVLLEEWLDAPVESFAYPVGAKSSYNATTVHLVEEAGYKIAFSLQRGALDPESRFEIPRVCSERDWSLNTAALAWPRLFAVREAAHAR